MQTVLNEPVVAPRQPQFETKEGQGELPKQAIIVDLDSTLALLGDRSPYNYDECQYDQLNKVIYRMVLKYKKDNYHILIVTGRPMSHAEMTQQWLEKYHVPYDMLVMRPEGDKQPDTSLKLRAYNQYIKGRYDVEFVLEDRTRVVKMWRENGLICLQVCNGDY